MNWALELENIILENTACFSVRFTFFFLFSFFLIGKGLARAFWLRIINMSLRMGPDMDKVMRLGLYRFLGTAIGTWSLCIDIKSKEAAALGL